NVCLSCVPPLASASLVVLVAGQIHGLSWRKSLQYLGMKRIRLRPLFLGLILSVPVLEGYFQTVWHYLGKGVPVTIAPGWPGLLIYFIASAGVFEEILFRG